MDHLKLGMHDGRLDERIEILALKKLLPVFQQRLNMDRVWGNKACRMRPCTWCAYVHLPLSPLAWRLARSSRSLQQLCMKSPDQGQGQRPPPANLFQAHLQSLAAVQNVLNIILPFDRYGAAGMCFQDLVQCCAYAFDGAGAPGFLQKPCLPEQVCPGRDLQHTTEVLDECCRLKLWHAEAAPLVLAGREGQRWKEKW